MVWVPGPARDDADICGFGFGPFPASPEIALEQIPVGLPHNLSIVMPGLVPGTHVFRATSKAWVAGTSPAMTHWVIPRDRNML